MELFHGVNLLRVGGHFPGSCVMHWAGSEGNGSGGILFTGAHLITAFSQVTSGTNFVMAVAVWFA